MTENRGGASFIRYELPVRVAGKPTKPQEEEGGKGKPRPITTLAVGEEGGGPKIWVLGE